MGAGSVAALFSNQWARIPRKVDREATNSPDPPGVNPIGLRQRVPTASRSREFDIAGDPTFARSLAELDEASSFGDSGPPGD